MIRNTKPKGIERLLLHKHVLHLQLVLLYRLAEKSHLESRLVVLGIVQQYMTSVKFDVVESLVPEMRIDSTEDPYEYAIMTPDYVWHYFKLAEDVYIPVTVTGEYLPKANQIG